MLVLSILLILSKHRLSPSSQDICPSHRHALARILY
jgi:hypothetical protein